jgi:hypothetical protein
LTAMMLIMVVGMFSSSPFIHKIHLYLGLVIFCGYGIFFGLFLFWLFAHFSSV